jgi:outer membrane protein assembly factor BamB
MVFVGASHNKMTAFDTKTMKSKWRFEASSTRNSAPSISAKDDIMYFGSDDGKLYAVKVDTGEKLWEFPTKGKIDSSPAIKNGVVYVSSQDGFLYAVR